MNRIEVSTDEGRIVFKPFDHLGGEAFRTYRSAVEGARYDPALRANVASVDKLPAILKRFRDSKFEVHVTPDAVELLKEHTAQMWLDLQGAEERLARVDADLATRGMSLYPFQRIGVKWLATRTGALLADEMGLGKAQPVSEPVLTPFGWRPMGSLTVGCEVIGSNGRPTRVLGVFPQGERPIYRVTMTDGSWTRVDGEHLWYVETPNDRFRKNKGRVLTTLELKGAGLQDRNGNRKWFVPVTAPVEYERGVGRASHTSPTLDPYALGSFIANGCLTQRQVGHSGSKEQRKEMVRACPELTFTLRENGVDSSFAWNGSPKKLWNMLEEMGIAGSYSYEKRVPQMYLKASVEERLALIQGLFDNDGTVSRDGCVVEYNTTSPGLAEDVLDLLRSLGAVARMSTRLPNYVYKGERKVGRRDYRIRVSMPPHMCPFRVAAKRERYKPRTKYLPAHAIASIEPDEAEEAMCIRVEADDRLYVTRNFIVTHNTVQAICALPAGAPVLVVCPAVAKGVWKREIARARPHLEVLTIEGRGNFRWPKPGQVIIVNADILPEVHRTREKTVKGKPTKVRACEDYCEGCLPILAEISPGTVVVGDEAHAFKSARAQRTLKMRAFCAAARKASGRSWLLTATPMLNRPQELWAIYSCAGIAQEAFGTWDNFLTLMGGTPGHFGGFEWGVPRPEAPERMQRVSLRRLKKDVLHELPAKTYRDLEVDVDKKTLKACDKILADHGGIERIVSLLESGELAFELLASIRQALAVAKIPALLELVEEYEEQEEPLVVFSAHRAVVDELKKRPGWAAIYGGVSPEERTRIEEAFQRGELKGVAATIQAGGVAITLTRARNAIFVDREWTPALNAQAEDRIHRIGQTRGTLITSLYANHILDQRITELLTMKLRLIAITVDAAADASGAVNGAAIAGDVDPSTLALRAAEYELALASAPRPEAPKKLSKFRPPSTPEEHWVANAVRTLSALDADEACEDNGVGWSKTDSGFGHALAATLERHGGLSSAQFQSAITMCRKYRRQVGECPPKEKSDGQNRNVEG